MVIIITVALIIICWPLIAFLLQSLVVGSAYLIYRSADFMKGLFYLIAHLVVMGLILQLCDLFL